MMRTLPEVLDQFGYHPATPSTASAHNSLREIYKAQAKVIWNMIPDGPEKTICMRKLQESLMYANLAVALTAPVDEKTADIARILPESD
jgi:hypothetical protein